MKLLSLLMVVLGVAVSSCGPRNNDTNTNGNFAYTPNDYCLRVQGQDPSCQGYNQYGNPYMRNYPMQGGYYNYNQGCGANWGTMYGQAGLGCYNQGMIGGNPYRWNYNSGYGTNISAAVSCTPGGYSYAPQCPAGTYCRPIDAYTGICSY